MARTKKSTPKTAVKSSKEKLVKAPAGPIPLEEAMAALEKAGSAQTRKTYARHGAPEPMFGVSFAVLKTLQKRIGVDHRLARELWATGNFDARNLAIKVADPAVATAEELTRWNRQAGMRMLCWSVAQLASEGPHAQALAEKWSASSDPLESCAAWALLGQLCLRDASLPDEPFLTRIAEIERTIHTAPNRQREAMNQALIAIGCRNAALRKAATAAARRIGKVEVDHGDTSCKTPDAAAYIEKTWAHSDSRGFPTPADAERARPPARIRC